jgi:putative glutamine amidotransferase
MYGAARDPATEATYPDRDRYEIALLRGAVARRIPVLGICRGLHVINVALGGTLVQDLVDVDGSHPHRKTLGRLHGSEHEVLLQPGSLAAEAAGEDRHTVSCHHHQTIDRLGDGLVVSGRAADGVVEAVEAADRRWLLGVQWHPEADEHTRLFKALHDAATSYALVN